MSKHGEYREAWDEDVGVDLLKMWSVVRRRKRTILSLAFIVTLLTALIVQAMTAIYSAEVLVHIQSKQAKIVSIEEFYSGDAGHRDYYNTQAEMMKSRPVAAKVIDAMGAPLVLESAPSTSLFELGFDWRAWVPFKPPEVNGGPIVVDQREKNISDYLKNVSVQGIRGTQLIKISVEAPDPRKASAYANAHANAYIESLLDARLSVTQFASNWMGDRIEELRANLKGSENQLQTFREKETLMDAEGINALSTLEINDLSARLVEVRRRLSLAKIAYLQVYGDDRGAIESVPAVLDDDAVRQFRIAQAQAEQRAAELAKRYGPKHPKMIAAQSELSQATESLARQQREVAGGIEADYLAAQSEVVALERELERAKMQYQAVTRKGSVLSELQREVDTNRQLYEMFYNRMREMAQTDDLASVNALVVQPAIVPDKPIKPNKLMILMLAFVLSLMVGIVSAFLLELLNNTIRSSGDVEEKLGVPLLGIVPLLGGNAQDDIAHAMSNDKVRGFGEAIRTVRTGISLSSIDNPHKLILVTSSIAGEGKSTVAMNLAQAFAQTERVLLLDADMRRPSIGREMGLDRDQRGLSELLDVQIDLKDVTVHLEGYDLDIIKTGLLPPDPLELLSSNRMSKLMSLLTTKYDRVIIDSPPVLPVSDAAVLSTYADALVYVIKSDATPITQIVNGLAMLRRFDAPLVGVVVNQFDLSKAERYGDYDYGGYYEAYDEAYDEASGAGMRRKKPRNAVATAG